jgi:hypothetical protein
MSDPAADADHGVMNQMMLEERRHAVVRSACVAKEDPCSTETQARHFSGLIAAVESVRPARPDLSARGAMPAAGVIADAVLSAMTRWSQENSPGSPSALAEELVDVRPEWITRASSDRQGADE